VSGAGKHWEVPLLTIVVAIKAAHECLSGRSGRVEILLGLVVYADKSTTWYTY